MALQSPSWQSSAQACSFGTFLENSTFLTSPVESTTSCDMSDSPFSVSPLSLGFEDYDQVQQHAFANVQLNPPGEEKTQQCISLSTGQLKIKRYIRPHFQKAPSAPVTTNSILACRTTPTDERVTCDVDQEKQQTVFKKARRREQNRVAQRSFRARKDECIKEMNEQYLELVKKYQNLRTLYDKQVERSMVLDSKLRDLTEEVTTQGLCNKCSWDILSDTFFRDIDLTKLQVSV